MAELLGYDKEIPVRAKELLTKLVCAQHEHERFAEICSALADHEIRATRRRTSSENGVQYVGYGRTTLADAIREIIEEANERVK
jgi:hypothetical protein